jgi:pyruvate dehydrogenase E2 component (dihydrolipoamide acetyltransferase)
MTSTVNLVVPDLGDFENIEVIEVLVSVGDSVSQEDGLIVVETDKASMDIPAPQDGVVGSLTVGVGDTVSTGDVIGTLSVDDAAAPETGAPIGGETTVVAPESKTKEAVVETSKPAASKPAPQAVVAAAPKTLPSIDEAGFSKAHASPSVRKLAREWGVNLVQVTGKGTKNRILHDDVKAFVKAILTGQAGAPAGAGLPKVPSIDFSKFGEIDVQPLTRIQKISGPKLQASWVNLPHVTQHDLSDITDLEAKRQVLKGPAKERGISLTPLAFIMKACVAALEEFPKVNSSLSDDGESLIFKKYCHMGFAADTPGGLVVPVIRDVNQKDVYEIAAELGELSALARDGKLKTPQLQGAGFTISSLGGIGGTAFTPIVNAPEVAILGVSRSSMQPVWNGSEFEPRLMLPLSFSYDHRVIDGAQAARFTTFLGKVLADVDSLLKASSE